MDIVVEALTSGDKRGWDAFLSRCPGATFYHSMEFQEHYRHKCDSVVYLMFRRGSKTVAALPAGLGAADGSRVLRSPFSASFAGFVFPATTGARTCLEVLEAFRGWCAGEGVASAEIQQTPGIYGGAGGDTVEYALLATGFFLCAYEVCHFLPLVESPESLFTSSAKAQYRQALDSGLELAPSTDLSASFDLVEKNKRLKGAIPSVPKDDYLALSELLEGKIHTYSVFLRGREIAVGVFYALSATGLMTFFLAHEEDALRHRPINYLVCEVARRSFGKGFRTLDLGTTSDGGVLNPGLSHFKEGLGGRPFLRKRFRRQTP